MPNITQPEDEGYDYNRNRSAIEREMLEKIETSWIPSVSVNVEQLLVSESSNPSTVLFNPHLMWLEYFVSQTEKLWGIGSVPLKKSQSIQ